MAYTRKLKKDTILIAGNIHKAHIKLFVKFCRITIQIFGKWHFSIINHVV